jgi:tRNA/tmRNA/rRNA uracil-C5-methylase (TrmA/RlmC/RlmD family)
MIELQLHSPSGQGASVGRDADGRAVFVEGGLPGETVAVDLQMQKKRFARGRVRTVIEAAPGRIEPICATARAGCGGCDLAHAELSLQEEMKLHIVSDSLQRIARLTDVPDIGFRQTRPSAYRTTVRLAIEDGAAGYRRRWSHDVVTASECRVAHPAIEDLLALASWGSATEVMIRVSEATGERLAVVTGSLDEVDAPIDVNLITRAELEAGASISLTEEAGGRSWQVSAGSFFQAGPAAADALVDAVAAAAGDTSGMHVVDAYCGIGLFAGTVGADSAIVTAIERDGSSITDARVNLSDQVRIEAIPVEQWDPATADVVIADPSRSGLGAEGVATLDAANADRFVLVSCDTGSLGRDVGLLAEAGYTVDSVEIVDAFPDTNHVETVVGLSR